ETVRALCFARVEQYRICFPAVPARSTGLLDVCFHGTGVIVVKDKPNLLLVDTHPKGVGCNHDLNLALHEELLNVMSRGGGESCVVGLCRYVSTTEQARKTLRFTTGRDIDNAGTAFLRIRDDLLNDADC